MKIFYPVIIFLFMSAASAQQSHSAFTEKSEREKFDAGLRNKIERYFTSELNHETEAAWREAFWGAGLLMMNTPAAEDALKRAFEYREKSSYEFKRALLEAVYTLFPAEFIDQIKGMLTYTDDPKLSAMCINYLLRAGAINKQDAAFFIKDKFEKWDQNPILYFLVSSLESEINTTPPLIDLLSAEFGGKTVIFSLQRKNRDHAGLVVIRKPDGSFVRDEFGNIFSVPQLARSLSSMPGYITNGNTPEGILSIQGIDTSENIFIGTTPNIQTVLPYEVSPEKYFHGKYDSAAVWSPVMYESLLPDGWKSYTPFYEAFYAGKAGRTEIIAHGTTVNPDYYSGKPYYPNTPTLGCLSAKELWNDEGYRVISDQQAFVNTFKSAESRTGYLVVVNLNDKEMPLVIDEIIVQVLQAENNLRSR